MQQQNMLTHSGTVFLVTGSFRACTEVTNTPGLYINGLYWNSVCDGGML